jgi:hypothetical protein
MTLETFPLAPDLHLAELTGSLHLYLIYFKDTELKLQAKSYSYKLFLSSWPMICGSILHVCSQVAERLIWLEISQQLVNDCTLLLLLALYL